MTYSRFQQRCPVATYHHRYLAMINSHGSHPSASQTRLLFHDEREKISSEPGRRVPSATGDVGERLDV